MPRNVTSAAANVLTLSLGALGFSSGMTLARIWKRAATDAGGRYGLWIGTDSGASRLAIGQNGDALRAVIGSNTRDSTNAGVTADGPWVMQAVTKATGTVVSRAHKYDYSTNAWVHEDMAVTLANNTTPTGSAYLMNRPTASTAAACSGDHAVYGVWDTPLTDAQIENLPFSLAAWFQVQPKGLWVLDQQATGQKVVDLSGGGANESALTGTTVSTLSVPVFNYATGLQ